MAERRYRWAHVLIVDGAAESGAARWRRVESGLSFTVLRAGGDYFYVEAGDLSASGLRRALDAALAAPARASVD